MFSRMIISIIVLGSLSFGATIPKSKSWRDLLPIYPEIGISSLPPGFEFPKERIVGGEIATPHDYPHQVALFLHKPEKTNFCGGSLISRRFVLTAAHCTDTATSIEVVLGAHNIRDESEQTQLRIETTKYVIHENYDSNTIVNDISIIELPQGAVTFSDIIQPIRLPKFSDVEKDFVDETAIVSGWGKITDQDTSYTDYLQHINLPIITNEACDEAYFGGMIKDCHICTSGADARATCNGDSGGALTIDGVQIGIVSFGIIFGCESGWPSAYTRVTEYLQWIQDHSDVIIGA